MPRKAKTQAIQTPTGLPYGEGQDVRQAQAVVPLADITTQNQAQATAPPPSPAGGGQPPQAAAPPAQPRDFASVLAAAQQMTPPQGLLNQPSDPNAVIPSGRTQSMWAQLAALTGDPSFLDLAVRARLSR